MKKKNKVLHIGNIANNAYLNAKILNSEANVESDVLSLDYYHIMGCPEWEDADFTGDYGDDNFPDWSKVDLNGFKRPSWFVQGHREYALKYLLAKNERKIFRSKFYKYLLKKSSIINKKNNNKKNKSIFTNYFYLFSALKFVLFVICNKDIRDFKKHLDKFSKIKLFILFVFLLPLMPILILYRIYARRSNGIKYVYFTEFENRVTELHEIFKEIQPEREGYFDRSYFTLYQKEIILWRKLFKYYDVIHAYGLDGVYPLLAKTDYFMFEHGTIRNFPFQNDMVGISCYLSYKLAKGVFITNADNIKAAREMKLDNKIFIPHPINEDYQLVNSSEDLHTKYDTDFIAFHPPRQHWTDKRGKNWKDGIEHFQDWEKGNDIFIRGFAKFVKKENYKARAIFVLWGKKIDESKKLISELDIENNVIWVKPMHNVGMVRTILSSDLLVDQFTLGAFGSTMPKALMCKKPAMIYLNEDIHKWCLDEMPPILNCSSDEDVYKSLCLLYKDRNYYNKKALESYEWYKKYHSNKKILEILKQMYFGDVNVK